MLIIQELLGYFLIGIIGMAILAVCYLPIYFIMRKRMPLLRQIAYFLFDVCVLVISTATFLDWVITCLLNGRAILATEHSLNLIPYRNLGYGGAETNYTDDSKYTNVFTFRFYIPCCIQESSYLL